MAETTDYAELTVDELKAELEKRDLPKSGKKADLVTRLEDDDTAQGGTAPEDSAAESDVVSESEAAAASETEAPAEDKPKRRGSEVSVGAKKRDSADREAPRDKQGVVAVRAQAKYVRSAPRKARLVMDHIRGKDVAQARAILRHTPRAAATDIAKLLESAVANAENNFELDPDELKVGRAFVDEGPTIKRYQPRALGRATRINKRTSHMTITLTTTTGNGA
jgi:large subunit ribosomal protein L22